MEVQPACRPGRGGIPIAGLLARLLLAFATGLAVCLVLAAVVVLLALGQGQATSLQTPPAAVTSRPGPQGAP